MITMAAAIIIAIAIMTDAPIMALMINLTITAMTAAITLIRADLKTTAIIRAEEMTDVMTEEIV